MNGLAAVIREEMLSMGIKGKDLAQLIFTAPSSLSEYLTQSKPMPQHVEAAIIESLGSPRISEERCAECRGNMFPTRYLDNVDEHPIVAIDKLVEESSEWLAMAELAKRSLINKKRGSRLPQDVDSIIKSFEDETADLVTGAKTLLIKMQEWYGRPVIVTMNRHVRKLEKQNYCTKKKAAASGR